MYPRGTPADSARVIGVRHAKVYKFAFQSLLALSSSTDSRASSSEMCEIWHHFNKDPLSHLFPKSLFISNFILVLLKSL